QNHARLTVPGRLRRVRIVGGVPTGVFYGASCLLPCWPFDVIRLARTLVLLGTAVAVVGLSKFHAAEVASPPYDYTASSRLAWSLGYIGMLIVSAYAAGLPDLPRTRRSTVMASAGAVLVAALGMSVIQLLLGAALLPRFVIFGSALLLVPWYWICVDLAADGRSRSEQRDRVIVVGSWADTANLTLELDESAERPAVIVDVLDPGAVEITRSEPRPLVAAAEAGDANVVVLDREAQASPTVVGQVADLHSRGVRVRTMSLFYEDWLGKLPVAELERVSLMFDIGEIHRARYGRLKRVSDIAVSLMLMPLVLVAVPLVWLGNRLGNKGPLLFAQERVGRAGTTFTIYKFRTMEPGGDSSWTTEDDPRITRFGGVLRLTHVDELPQVWNILRGDLSLIGPRPEQLSYVTELREKLPFYDLRHLVRPGLTGWAQVKYGYAGSESDALEKLQYEFYYLRHQGWSLDARIAVRTLRRIASAGGR
ncbi:MAG: sugar transferase, partial [Acidimicrobiales bacterium]